MGAGREGPEAQCGVMGQCGVGNTSLRSREGV